VVNKTLRPRSGVCEIAFDTEQRTVRKLLQSVFRTYSLAHWRYADLEHLYSVRYLLKKHDFTSFCALVHSTPEGLQRCRESDRQLITEVRSRRKPCFHVCHAGLIDFAFPIPSSVNAWPVLGGQLLFRTCTEDDARRVLENVRDLPLKREAVARVLTEVPVVPYETVARLIVEVTAILEEFPGKEMWRNMGRMSDLGDSRYKALQGLVTFLKEHYKEDHTIGRLAAQVNLSPSYLQHLFHEEFGLSVMEYRRHLRVEAAKAILRDTRMSVTEIAFALGWHDSNYFSCAFKKAVGLSPLAFRKRMRKSIIL